MCENTFEIYHDRYGEGRRREKIWTQICEAIRVCETRNPHWASVETTIQALPKPILEKDPCPAVFTLV